MFSNYAMTTTVKPKSAKFKITQQKIQHKITSLSHRIILFPDPAKGFYSSPQIMVHSSVSNRKSCFCYKQEKRIYENHNTKD
jgi:hypothetical protein